MKQWMICPPDLGHDEIVCDLGYEKNFPEHSFFHVIEYKAYNNMLELNKTNLEVYQKEYYKMQEKITVLEIQNSILQKELLFYKTVVEVEKETMGEKVIPREEGNLQATDEKK